MDFQISNFLKTKKTLRKREGIENEGKRKGEKI